MPELASVNGEIVPLAEATVPANDRALFFGDGVYEAVRVVGGRGWLMDEHLARFARSLEGIGIRHVDLDEVRTRIDEVVAAAGMDRALLYFHVTRGAAPRLHTWDDGLRPNLFVSVREFRPPKVWPDGVAAITHPDLRWKRCDLKTLNLLPNVLAKQQAHRQGAHEAILVNDPGYVTEASSMAVCCVLKGTLVSCPNGPHILPSITRAKVFSLAAEAGIPARERWFRVEDLLAADEVFLSATSEEVCPVIRIDDRPLPGPGPISRRLKSLHDAALAAFEQES